MVKIAQISASINESVNESTRENGRKDRCESQMSRKPVSDVNVALTHRAVTFVRDLQRGTRNVIVRVRVSIAKRDSRVRFPRVDHA